MACNAHRVFGLLVAASLATPIATAAAAAADVSLQCENLAEPICDDVAFELRERLAARGRTLRVATDPLPHVTVSPAAAGEVRVEVTVAGRPPLTEVVDVSREVAPAWAVALVAERLLDREESAAAAALHRRREAPAPRSAAVEPPEHVSDVWFGVQGGVASAYFPTLSDPALRAGGIAGFPIARPVLVHAHAYVERLGRAPWAAEAFGLAAGPGLTLVDRPWLQLAWTAEGFIRLLTVRYALVRSGSDVEGGAGTWLVGTFGSGSIRPMLGAGVEAYARRNPTVTEGEEVHHFGASLVTPALFLAVVYHPG